MYIDCDCDLINTKINNALGQLVYEQAADLSDTNIQIPTSQLPNGLYIIIGKGENGEIYFARN